MLISTAVLNEAHLKITSLFEIPTQHYLSIVRYAVRSTAGVAQPDLQNHRQFFETMTQELVELHLKDM